MMDIIFFQFKHSFIKKKNIKFFIGILFILFIFLFKIKHYFREYDLNGGLSSRRNPKSYTYFSDTIHLLSATKPGYEFVGWFDKRGNELNVIREHSMGNKHLIAQFRKREFD